MGIVKDDLEEAEDDQLAGDAPRDPLSDLNSLVRSPSVFLRLYAFHMAAALTALVAAILFRNPWIAGIAAGLCIRPVATWIAFSDASDRQKAVAGQAAKVLRGVFVAYCLYLMLRSFRV
jgi:hypothetical protein